MRQAPHHIWTVGRRVSSVSSGHNVYINSIQTSALMFACAMLSLNIVAVCLVFSLYGVISIV